MTAPFQQTIETDIPAAGAAVDQDTIIGEAPFDGTLAGATLFPEAAVTGATATKRTFTIVNKGQAGAGTTVMATLDLVTGENLVAYDEKAFTLSVVAGATAFVAGDVLAVNETHAGAGTAHSGGKVKLELSRS